MRPICSGSLKAVPGHSIYQDPEGFAVCEFCGARLQLDRGCFPRHRYRQCLAPGCEANARVGGLCTGHDREIVGGR